MRASDLCADISVAAAIVGVLGCVLLGVGWMALVGCGVGLVLMLAATALDVAESRRADAARSRREVEEATYRWERVRTLRADEAREEDK